MSLIKPNWLLQDARDHGYAIGAFNVENMDMARAVLSAANTLHRPVILQTTPSTLHYTEARLFATIVSALAARVSVPVALHLDHGNSYGLVIEALTAGYTSVMIDGSALPFEENIRLTAKTVEAAAAINVPVEAELGRVGGKEDDLTAQNGDYTDPDTAAVFVAHTKVQSLAVAIGTAHGVYAEPPRLDISRLQAIREQVTVPLVLHGASGLPDEVIKDCIRHGISKVNFATELRMAYSDGVKAYFRTHPQAYDPKAYGIAGHEKVYALALDKIGVCG